MPSLTRLENPLLSVIIVGTTDSKPNTEKRKRLEVGERNSLGFGAKKVNVPKPKMVITQQHANSPIKTVQKTNDFLATHITNSISRGPRCFMALANWSAN